jgi:hypothetical protein
MATVEYHQNTSCPKLHYSVQGKTFSCTERCVPHFGTRCNGTLYSTRKRQPKEGSKYATPKHN